MTSTDLQSYNIIDTSPNLLSSEGSRSIVLPLESLPRECIESGDYREPQIDFVSTTLVSHEWSSWKHYILSKPRNLQHIRDLGIEDALNLSTHQSIFLDNKALSLACLRWVAGVHTLVFD